MIKKYNPLIFFLKEATYCNFWLAYTCCVRHWSFEPLTSQDLLHDWTDISIYVCNGGNSLYKNMCAMIKNRRLSFLVNCFQLQNAISASISRPKTLIFILKPTGVDLLKNSSPSFKLQNRENKFSLLCHNRIKKHFPKFSLFFHKKKPLNP